MRFRAWLLVLATLTSSGSSGWAAEFRQRFDPLRHWGVVERTRHELSEPGARPRP